MTPKRVADITQVLHCGATDPFLLSTVDAHGRSLYLIALVLVDSEYKGL